jgi:hypothetical protein
MRCLKIIVRKSEEKAKNFIYIYTYMYIYLFIYILGEG